MIRRCRFCEKRSLLFNVGTDRSGSRSPRPVTQVNYSIFVVALSSPQRVGPLVSVVIIFENGVDTKLFEEGAPGPLNLDRVILDSRSPCRTVIADEFEREGLAFMEYSAKPGRLWFDVLRVP